MKKVCIDCGAEKSKKGLYCRICRYKYAHRPSGLTYTTKVANKGWYSKKIEIKSDSKGYIQRRFNGVMRREHRVVMENFISRKLCLDEVVHHRNGDKTDNRLINLVLLSKIDHDSIHRGIGIKSLTI